MTHLSKLEDCPECGEPLTQAGYDAQYCRCGWGPFGRPSKSRELLEALALIGEYHGAPSAPRASLGVYVRRPKVAGAVAVAATGATTMQQWPDPETAPPQQPIQTPPETAPEAAPDEQEAPPPAEGDTEGDPA